MALDVASLGLTTPRRSAASPSRACSCVLRPGVLRRGTYLGVTDEDVDRAAEAIPRALGALVRAEPLARARPAPPRAQAEWRMPAWRRRLPGRRDHLGGRSARGRRCGRRGDADHQYRIGSITKTFTAVLVLQLRDEGRLDLDSRSGSRAEAPGRARRCGRRSPTSPASSASRRATSGRRCGAGP